MRYSIMCKVYNGFHGTSEIEHGLCACTVDNPLTKARGLSLRTGTQTMLYLSLVQPTDPLKLSLHTCNNSCTMTALATHVYNLRFLRNSVNIVICRSPNINEIPDSSMTIDNGDLPLFRKPLQYNCLHITYTFT